MQSTLTNDDRTLREKRSDAGRVGGRQTLANHGREHFQKIGRAGAKVFHSRYRLDPIGSSDFAIVHRETGEVRALLSGLPW